MLKKANINGFLSRLEDLGWGDGMVKSAYDYASIPKEHFGTRAVGINLGPRYGGVIHLPDKGVYITPGLRAGPKAGAKERGFEHGIIDRPKAAPEAISGGARGGAIGGLVGAGIGYITRGRKGALAGLLAGGAGGAGIGGYRQYSKYRGGFEEGKKFHSERHEEYRKAVKAWEDMQAGR